LIALFERQLLKLSLLIYWSKLLLLSKVTQVGIC